MLGHQRQHEIVKPKKQRAESSSARSMSQSSKHVVDSINQVVADVKNKFKSKGGRGGQHGHGGNNDSFNSSKKIVKDEKNTSNQRSRSTQLNRTHFNN